MTEAEAHPPTHILAELAEGALDDARAREVRAHVDECLTCQTTIDELAQVTVALRGVPAELPVPEFVSARVFAALAAEHATGPVAVGARAAARTGTDRDGGTVAWFRRRLPQGLAAAASIAVVGLVGYVVLSGGLGGTGGSDADSGVVAADEEAEAGDSAASGPRNLDDQTTTQFREGVPSPADGTEEAAGVDEAELAAAVTDIEEQRSRVSASCGEVLADELGEDLVGSQKVGSGVLIVLDSGNTLDGWLLSTCNSLSNETLEPHVVVPKAE